MIVEYPTRIEVRRAVWDDQDVLYDLDLKCFDDVWPKEYWLHWFQDFKVVFLAYIAGVPVGLAACEHSNQEILIDKFGAKPQYRRLDVSRNLLLAVHLQALNYDNQIPVYLIVPEPWLYSGSDDVSGWIKRIGFMATTPLLSDYFRINGVSMDGVKCVFKE